MKKYCLYIIFFVLLGCSAQDKSVEIEPVCRETGCFKWTDKKQAVEYYEQLLDNVVSLETASLTYEQIDAMLYLSYIYLTDSEYKDINKANNLLIVAKKAICKIVTDIMDIMIIFVIFNIIRMKYRLL